MGKQLGYLLEGLSRDERLIRALLPESVQLEDRDSPALLKLLSDLSRHIVYFNDSNRPEGNWEEFFKTDFNILNNLVTRFDLQGYLNHFYQLELKLERSVNDHDVLDALKKIFYFIFAAAIKMHELSERLLAVQRTPVFTVKLKDILVNLKEDIALLREYNNQAIAAFEVPFIEKEAFVQLGFDQEKASKNIFEKGIGISEKTGNAFKDVKIIFNSLRTNFNRVLNACKFYVNENPVQEQSYSPHLALVVTFLELYDYLKTDVNKLPSKHLEFYYQNILGFNRLPAVPDKVNLLFEALPDAKQVILQQGELVSGNIPGHKDSLMYRINEKIELSKAHISSLKTLFTVQNVRIAPKMDATKTISEVQLYKAEYNNPEPKFIVKNADNITSLSMLGQDINELSPAERSNLMADTGFLIASPVLYQQYGSRKILLKLHIEPDSFGSVVDYFNNYQGLSDSVDNVQYMLLDNAFVIEFTGPSGWEKAGFTRVNLNQDDKSLEVELIQGTTDLPFTCYAPVHGALPGLKWPAIRLLINNQANFNPLAYLKYLKIERITVRAEVKGLVDYTLQNNIGNLSNATAFQPFGPLSPAGSYFDIVNANVFNRYLSSAALKLEWAGLPDVVGGFETYYEQYLANIKNSSFKVRLLSLKNADNVAAGIKNEFALFESDLDANFEPVLKHSTTFEQEDIDVKELAYTNDPVLDRVPAPLSGEMSEGALRIEFYSPRFGFGHSSFAGVFSQTALHNSKRFVKKKTLPEQPYTPLLNNVFIDYVQSTAEQLDNAAGNMEGFSSIAFIHLQPFGYEQVFPGKIRSSYSLIPYEDYDNNFYIGFDKIVPAEEISILFHLEEKTFHESAVKLQSLQWSYLYNDSWLRMNEKYVLSDTTENLIKTGIVRLIVPPDINTGNTCMPAALYWIRISSSGKNIIRSKIKALYINAVCATRIIEPGAPGLLELPAGILKTFVNPVKGVQNIWQLFPSFGGKEAENEVEFYIRVSQRLRHKNRLLMSKDIEQAVLENFPDIFIAKCIRSGEDDSRAVPDSSSLKIVLVALNENSGRPDMTPMVSLDTLCKVKDFLQTRLSPQVNISVENPVYERVKVVCKVRLVSESHSEELFYIRLLENDINEFISPWYFRADVNYRIGGKLFVSEMYNFIKTKPYISSVEEFGLAHFYNYESTGPEEVLTAMDAANTITSGFLTASVPEGIFIPSQNHFIEIADAQQQQNENEFEAIGLNYLTVGEELLVGEDSGTEKKVPAAEKKENKQYYNWVISKKDN